MIEKHSLYDVIKDKLSPNTRRKLEKQMEYNDFVKMQERYKKELK